jgi:hypothetical protein
MDFRADGRLQGTNFDACRLGGGLQRESGSHDADPPYVFLVTTMAGRYFAVC